MMPPKMVWCWVCCGVAVGGTHHPLALRGKPWSEFAVRRSSKAKEAMRVLPQDAAGNGLR